MKIKTASISFLIVIALLLGPSTTVPAATRGSIYVGPMASGEAVRILSTGYVLQPLTNACPDCLGIVVGPADLSNPSIVNRLKAVYEAGHAAGLTNATNASIQRLHDLLGHHGSAQPVPGGAQVDLVAFRKASRNDGQLHFSSHLLLPRAATATAGVLLTKGDKMRLKRLSKSLRRKLRQKLVKRRTIQIEHTADRADIGALSRIFSATPEVPQPPLGASPQQNIVQLAESYQSHAIQSDAYGNQVQVVNSVWGARSFLNSADLYYVFQETDYHILNPIFSFCCDPSSSNDLSFWSNNVGNLPFAANPILIQPAPQTTMEATTVTTSVSHTIGGSVGWNQSQGLDASVSASSTMTNSKTTTIPPINIIFDSSLSTGNVGWTYAVNDLPGHTETLTLYSNWIWEIPFSDYKSGQTEFQFGFAANVFANWGHIFSPYHQLTAGGNASVPMPFGRTFAIQPPVVTGVSPTCVNSGDQFTIQGTGMYPSLVQSVLIGGTAVNPANITTVSDTQINVIAPDTVECHGAGCSVAVQTAQGTSNTNFTIAISDFCD